ncbi:MAG: SpoIIE family protein phosphatase [Pseudonocardiales bacterium]|nr:SpoIIE family protein phosphatase [Pseudonocardiales bacterium]
MHPSPSPPVPDDGTAPDDVGELRRQLDRLRLLTDAAAALSAAATPGAVVDTAVEHFGRLLGTTSVAVFELRGADSLDAMTLGGWVQGARDAWTTMPLDAPAPVAEAARHRGPVWTESPAAWRTRYPHLVGMLDDYGYRGVLGLPLVAGGELIGAVGIGFLDDRELDADERAAVVSLGDQCAQALQRARLLQVESDARQSAEQLTAMVAALSRARTPDQVVAAIAAAARELGATSFVVAVRGPGPDLDLLGDPAAAPGPAALPADAAHPLAHAVRTGEPVWLARRSELAWRERSFSGSPSAPDVDVAVPMVLDDRAVGAVGMGFAGDPPHWSPGRRQSVLTLAAQCAQALDRARLQQVEHEIADTLQRSLLPERLPELDRLALAARYLPGADGSQAGGDWYDVIELDATSVALVVGDVVGKGPAAAALMGRLRTALAVALLRGDGPAAALGQLDRFCARVPAARASTAACLLLDRESGRVRWASAGHPPPVVLEGETGAPLEGALGPVLGLSGARPSAFPEHACTLAPGDTLVIYTDGLVERRGERLDEGLARLAAAGAREAAQPPARLADALLRALLDDVDPADDVALVVTRLLPPPWRGAVPARAEELRRMRRAVERWAFATGLDADQADDLQFALGEAVANAIEHAYRERPRGEVAVGLTRRADGAVQVQVADSGSWRPAPPDPGFRGRGLEVIRAIGTDVDVAAGADGTRVGFRVPPAPPGVPVPARRAGGAGTPVPADVTVTEARGERRLAIDGEIDLAGAGAIGDRVRAAVADAPPGTRIVLDLTATAYVASAGVALLLDAVERARARGLPVDACLEPGGAVARILALTGVEALLGVPVTGVESPRTG